ncbi:protein kinase domain-containing protein [Anabaena sp. UHCC 0451]|uniref:protein kinase domain-containing protein n=1 Tax=Anabaena sp. UHCC 0451 TaxID=2055235 RepID=UPI002B20E0BF|nr:GUN4 domain-containing protein [Anabaena sp. UHCC 0451]MEA5576678.1 GUN4 domain-containing protein [Anabaena sp. UHCC 0451]
MRQCLNPDCLFPNPDNSQYCQKCGNKLLLRERYAPQSILGQGGFGRTFLAIDEDKPSKPFCVIKQFLPQAQGTDSIEKASQLFAQEAQRLEELGKHPQIPELMAYFTSDNRQYLVQEFVKGATLQTELDNNGVFSEQEIRGLLIEVLQILDFVHGKQVIHRDIKPENIILSSDNKLFLVDFGAAKIVKPQQRTATGTIIGSAEYCAPEQSMGKPLFISDLYSLGVTCLHLLTGISPFDLYSPMEGEWVWRDFLNGNVVSNELGKILEKLASPIAKHRYQSVKEVIQALNFVDQNKRRSPSKVLPVPPPPPPVTRRSQVSTPPSQPSQPPVKIPQPSVTVPSQYQKLEKLLAEGKWKEADEETGRVMLLVGKQEKLGVFSMLENFPFLTVGDIDNFPHEDLHTINQFWLKYSKGKFGFSVQKKIYQDLGGTRDYQYQMWNQFGEKVGWKKGETWFDYSDLTFSLTAPIGHLPLGGNLIITLGQNGGLGLVDKFVGGWVGGMISWSCGCLLLRPDL